MSVNAFQREIPAWAVAAAVALFMALLFLAWHALFRNPNDAGPPKAVHAGMYDLRQEIQKAQAHQPAGSTGGF
jgi:hypothetical protein